jgi:putative flippase GtrA
MKNLFGDFSKNDGIINLFLTQNEKYIILHRSRNELCLSRKSSLCLVNAARFFVGNFNNRKQGANSMRIKSINNIDGLMKQFCKFGVVGTICFGVDYGVLVILTEFTGLGYLMSGAISFVISVIINYMLSMRFVFQGKEDLSRTQELVIFVILSLIGLVFNQIFMWIGVEFLGLFYAIAKIISTMLVTTYNFISRKLFLECER